MVGSRNKEGNGDRRIASAPAIDPTENVIALVKAENKRQDDLRDAHSKFVEAEIEHVQDTAKLRSEHTKQMGEKESDRLDKIRQVDVLNASTAAAQALTAIQTLATTTTANAETLRALVTSTAAAIATQTATTVSTQNERIAALEKSSYEGAGKQRVSDPLVDKLLEEVKGLRESRAGVTAKSEGIHASWLILIGAVALISTLMTIGVAVYTLNRNPTSSPPQQVIYIPTTPAAVTPTAPKGTP